MSDDDERLRQINEIKRNRLILKKKIYTVNDLLNSLNVAKEAYEKATTEEEKNKKRDEYNVVEKKFNEALKDYEDFDKEFNVLMDTVKERYNIISDTDTDTDTDQAGGKPKSKRNSKKVSKKPVVSQKKQSEYKEILGKKMKIYKMPDSRKEYVKYKGELHHITHYKNLMKQKAAAKAAAKASTKAAPKLRNKI
jgi:hypothetical protein